MIQSFILRIIFIFKINNSITLYLRYNNKAIYKNIINEY